MRIFLLFTVVILIAAAPFVGDKTVMHGWELITTVIFPVMVPMYFFILPLDMTMCFIMMQEKPDDVRKHYRRIIWLELVLMILLLLAWLPFVIRLVSS
jgi:hypothetical protein